MSFEARLARGTPLPPCTSSTRRADIGGLPPRVGIPIALDDPAGWQLRDAVEAAVRGTAAPHAVARRQKIDRVRRALASGAALGAVLGPDERALREQAEAMDAGDPRLAWLLSQAPRWRDAREKTLVFVAHRETLEMLRTALSHRAQLATGVFHEELSPARRDTEVARFREPDGPSLLVSTECGGEGRNFEFCRRLVLFDLPWKPSVVEQRIGRLDRIGRRMPVEIVYFRPPGGIGADVVRLFEALGLFREPLAGLEPQLAHVEGALEEIALDPLGVALRRALRRARRRSPRGAHAHPRSGLPAAPSRPLPIGHGRGHPRARTRGARRAQPGSGGHGLHRPGVHRRAPARPADLRDRARQRSAGRRPAGRPRRVELRRLVRPRGGRRERDDRLLRLRASARRGDLCPLRGRAPWAGSRGSKSRSAGNATRGSWPSTRTAPRSRWWRSTPPVRLGRTGRRRSVERSLRAHAVSSTEPHDSDWTGHGSSVWVHSSTRPAVRTRSPLSWCDRRSRPGR